LALIAERRINEAIEAGEFEDLPGTGLPIADLDEPYDPDWWIKSWLRRNRSLYHAEAREAAESLRQRLFHAQRGVRKAGPAGADAPRPTPRPASPR
jgi:hypothetical protein